MVVVVALKLDFEVSPGAKNNVVVGFNSIEYEIQPTLI